MAVSLTACRPQGRNFMNFQLCPSIDFTSKKKQIQGNLGEITYWHVIQYKKNTLITIFSKI